MKEDPNELDQMYAEIGETITKINSDRTTKTSLLIIDGDFNAKVGKTKGEQCLGSYSRGTRNTSGQTLVDFCNVHNSFKHPARHTTTWENTRINKNNGSVTKVYNQIDYIICQTDKKHILQNARSYAGTQLNSDHRLIITKLKTSNYNLFKPKPNTKHKPINTSCFSEAGVKEQYKTYAKEQMHTIEIEQFEENQQKWDKIVNTLVECGEQTLGFKMSTKNNITSDIEIEKLSNEQKQLRIQITS